MDYTLVYSRDGQILKKQDPTLYCLQEIFYI